MPPDAIGQELFTALGIDLAPLLAPLPTGDGGGEDMRYTPEFDRIAEARHTEDDSSQGIWQTDAKKADWPGVVRMGAELLATRTKDLQIAIWMTEALVALHGLRGAAAGIELIARLSEAFWATLWPRPEDGDIERRLSPYYWLDTHLVPALMRLPIAEPTENERVALSYFQLVKARKLQQLAGNNQKAYQAALSEGEISIEVIERAILGTSDGFFEAQAEGSRLTVAALAHLSETLDKVAGREAPSFTELRRTLDEIERIFTQTLAVRGKWPAPATTNRAEEAPAQEAQTRQDGDNMERTDLAPAGPGGLPNIASRRGAYALLEHAANWLLIHEPHSPAAYLVKRAVTWENKTLRDVLSELMARGADRDVIFEMLGLEGEGRPAAPRGR